MANLQEYKEKYRVALAAFGNQRTLFKKWQEQFEGSKTIDGGKPATSVYNFTRELIEAQIDSNIPQPSVQPKRPSEKNRELADIITSMIRNELDRLPSEQLNDLDERITRIMSGNVYLTEWDNTKKSHNTVGAIVNRLVTPMEFIPQEAVYDIEKMDYLFFTFDDTKSRIKMRYGKNVESEGTDSSTSETVSINDDMITQIICFYRNSKNGIGCISWVGDITLINDDNYFARKDKVCAYCGKTQPKGESKCICGSDKWEKRSKDFEILTQDVVLSNGEFIPSVSPVINENGEFEMEEYQTPLFDAETGSEIYERTFDDLGMVNGESPVMQTGQRVKVEPTKIPYYYPSDFPVAVRKNVSAYQRFFGDSDCAAIKEQQLQANKAMTKIDRKIANTAEFLTKPSTLNFSMSNGNMQVLNIENPAQLAMIKAISLEFNAMGEYNTIERAYYQAKSLLGVSDTFQGKADPTATSGRAKEIQVAQAAGIQKSKRVMKNAAYSKLFENMFHFMLAYADEPRAYTAMDENGQQVEKIFNRYDFLEQDEYGNWYYNDEFLFSVDEAGAMQTDKQFLLEDVRTDFGMGAFGNPQEPETMLMYWKEKEVLSYPNAKRMVKYWQEKVIQIEQQLQAQQQMEQQMLPSVAPLNLPVGLNGIGGEQGVM